MLALLQDAANMTHRSQTLWWNFVRCINRKWECKKRCKTFAMAEPSNTVQILVACAMWGIRFSSMNCLRWGGRIETGSEMKVCVIYGIQSTRINCLWLGNTIEMVSQIGVYDWRHTLQTDELFAIRQHNRNGQADQLVCDWWHTLHTNELFAISHNK